MSHSSGSDSGSETDSHTRRQSTCTVFSRTFSIFSARQPCGSKVTYFEFFTDPLPSATIDVINTTFGSSCEPTIIIERGDGKTIKRTLSPQQPVSFEIGLTVDSIKRISIECKGGNQGDFCEFDISFTARYCVCS